MRRPKSPVPVPRPRGLHGEKGLDALSDGASTGEPNADPLAPLLGGIVFPEEMVRRMIEACDADELEKRAAGIARREVSTILETYRREGIPFDFGEIMAEIFSGYFHMFRIEGNSIHRRRRVMTLGHKRGLTWSRYLRAYLLTAYSMVSNEKVEIEISDQFVQIKFAPGRTPPHSEVRTPHRAHAEAQ